MLARQIGFDCCWQH